MMKKSGRGGMHTYLTFFCARAFPFRSHFRARLYKGGKICRR